MKENIEWVREHCGAMSVCEMSASLGVCDATVRNYLDLLGCKAVRKGFSGDGSTGTSSGLYDIRTRLRSRGYVLDRGSRLVQWDRTTKRSPRMERTALRHGLLVLSSEDAARMMSEAIPQQDVDVHGEEEPEMPVWRKGVEHYRSLKQDIEDMRERLQELPVGDPEWSALCGRIRAAECRLLAIRTNKI